MKAYRNALPEWLTSSPRKSDNLRVVLSGMTGIIIALGTLNVAGQAFLQTTVKNLADKGSNQSPSRLPKSPEQNQRPGTTGTGS